MSTEHMLERAFPFEYTVELKPSSTLLLLVTAPEMLRGTVMS